MAKRKFDDKALTQQVVRSVRKARDPRLKQVMTSFIRHMHDFVRDVKPTPDEWMTGIRFLTETGQWCSGKRQEYILLSDTLGVSMLVDALNNKAAGKATESTVLGPFHREGAPKIKLGDSICKPGTPGKPCIIRGTVRDTKGRPVPHARMDLWETDAEGLYDSQRGNAMNARGVLHADAAGRFWFRCVLPTAYPVPHDGPVGRMLTATGRHPMRPPHLHFWITAPGCRPLITHLFAEGGKYLDSDAVFGVKDALVVPFRKGKGGAYEAHYDFVLMPEKKAGKKPGPRAKKK